MMEISEEQIGNSIGNIGRGIDTREYRIVPSRTKLNKLTYRQYLALSLIVTKLETDSIYPTKKELKETIGFKTDRMLIITLKALEKKGFIKFNGMDQINVLQITEKTKEILPLLIDKLLLIKEYTPYSEVRNKITRRTIENYLDMDIQHPFSINKKYIKLLNNEKEIVNRWYTLLEDFPPSLVWGRLEKYGISHDKIVLDPFCGSGTTTVTTKLYGAPCIGIDINPIATFVTKIKTTWRIDLDELKREINLILNDLHEATLLLNDLRITTPSLMNIPKMERYQWLKPYDQNNVAFIKERLLEVENEDIRNIFLLSLIGATQESSNASFCPGTSFYPFKKRPTFFNAFKEKLKMIYEDLKLLRSYKKNYQESLVYRKDMRQMAEIIESNSIDFLFTSPPYPNDLEYTRQTRLDLYLLDFIKDMKDVTKIKKKMIKGSTKLIYKESNSAKYVRDFRIIQDIAQKLEDALNDKKWGWDYPRMIQEYFGDIFLALKQTKHVLKKGGYAEFVVGDQTYKKILIPVGKVMTEMAKKLNYSEFKLETFRIRRSTIHDIPLKEEIVTLRK